MRHSVKFFFAILLILAGCYDELELEYQNINREKKSFLNSDKQVEPDCFESIKEFSFNMSKKDSSKFIEINKVIELSNRDMLILDRYSTSLMLLDSSGIIKKRFGRKGRGPDEFHIISDICLDDEENIYALDANDKVNKYSVDGKFIKAFSLSFSLRELQRIMFLGENKFLITAYQNLTEVSTKTSYDFLDYDQRNYLHIYDNNFKKLFSFRKLSLELKSTKGRLSRSIGQFISNSLWGDNIISVTQEGLYRINIYSKNGELIKLIDVNRQNFKNIDLNIIKEMKFSNRRWNFSQEKIGEIIADHSTIRDLMKIDKYYIMSIYDPYENFYPQFRKNYADENFSYDIFYFDEYSNMIPLLSEITYELKLVGVGKKNTAYFTTNNKNNKIILRKIKLKI